MTNKVRKKRKNFKINRAGGKLKKTSYKRKIFRFIGILGSSAGAGWIWLNWIVRCSGVDVAMTTGAASGRKGTAKLNELLKMQQVAQERWQRERIFEIDAAEPGSEEAKYDVVL